MLCRWPRARLEGRGLEHGFVRVLVGKKPHRIRMLTDAGKVDLVDDAEILERMYLHAFALSVVLRTVGLQLRWADQAIFKGEDWTNIDLRCDVDSGLTFLSGEAWLEVKWTTNDLDAAMEEGVACVRKLFAVADTGGWRLAPQLSGRALPMPAAIGVLVAAARTWRLVLWRRGCEPAAIELRLAGTYAPTDEEPAAQPAARSGAASAGPAPGLAPVAQPAAQPAAKATRRPAPPPRPQPAAKAAQPAAQPAAKAARRPAPPPTPEEKAVGLAAALAWPAARAETKKKALAWLAAKKTGSLLEAYAKKAQLEALRASFVQNSLPGPPPSSLPPPTKKAIAEACGRPPPASLRLQWRGAPAFAPGADQPGVARRKLHRRNHKKYNKYDQSALGKARTRRRVRKVGKPELRARNAVAAQKARDKRKAAKAATSSA